MGFAEFFVGFAEKFLIFKYEKSELFVIAALRFFLDKSGVFCGIKKGKINLPKFGFFSLKITMTLKISAIRLLKHFLKEIQYSDKILT